MRSCETQLIITVNDLMTYCDKKVQMNVAILDFLKVLDVDPHERLLQKLSHYGIRWNIHAWITPFLKDRWHFVRIDGARSDKVHAGSGVPQGTVYPRVQWWGHYSFAVHQWSSMCASLRTIACLLYRLIRSEKDQANLQRDLDSLSRWAETWSMRFNPSKCHIISVGTTKKFTKFYSYCGCILSLREDVHWNLRISSVAARANQTLAFLCRNLKGCPAALQELAYFSLVRFRVPVCQCCLGSSYSERQGTAGQSAVKKSKLCEKRLQVREQCHRVAPTGGEVPTCEEEERKAP